MQDADQHSVESARRAADRDELGEWVARFLASPGSDNAELAEQLSDPPRHWLGPVEIAFDHLRRLAGPPDEPVLVPMEEDDWRDDVDELAGKIADGLEPPPVIATWRHGHLALEDGNHRVEALRRSGRTTAWTIIGFDDPDERDRFAPPAEA